MASHWARRCCAAFTTVIIELPVKEGNVILIVPADLDQTLDIDALYRRAEALAPDLGYSLQSLIKAVRSAT